MLRKIFASVIVSCLLGYTSFLYSGITGTLSGKVIDTETGSILPGAAIFVEGTTMGAMADKNGHYMIHNLPAGTYDVSVSMIGYSKLTIKEIQINVDLNTELNFYLSTEVLPLEEVVVTKQRELIQNEITSSTYFVSGEDINDRLPIDSYRDAISLLPGVVGNNIRGGRENEVLYMLDGLPIQSGLSSEISSYFPNSSIVEMMVQTGGFTAEYGQATSGIVNVVTKNGGNEVEGNLKVYTDFFDTGLTENDNTRRMEFNVGGPLTIGLGGPIIHAKYFISGDLNLSDTAFREKMKEAFDSPIFSNYNINSKLSFDIGSNTIFALQGLVSNWKWRKFDPQWERNLSGLAENRHYSHRISASLTHTFTPRFFTSLRAANYSYERQILGSVEQEPPNLEFEDPTDPNSHILNGEQPWQENTDETVNVVKLDFVAQASSHHLLKTGIDFQDYNLNSRSINFTAIPSFAENSAIVFNKMTNNFRYSPKFFAFYFQDKLEFNGIVANLGLRYDIFAPDITVERLPQEFQDLRALTNGPPSEMESKIHNPLSPRLGVSFPLSKKERLHVNYGWYYQMPPLYYLYTNADHSLNSYLPIIGNVSLKPIKTISSEFSYKRLITEDMLLTITGFYKKFHNLIDTRTYILPDSTIQSNTSPVGFTKYTNSAFGTASGIELSLQKQFSNNFYGRFSYTYMKAKGTSSSAEDEFNIKVFGAPPSNEMEFPLSWDQRHSFVLSAGFENNHFQMDVLYRLFSPLPVTTPGSPTPNNERLSWRNIFDLKVKINTNRLLSGRLKPFFEIRNLFDEKNIISQSGSRNMGATAYRLYDPINSDFGRRLRVGMAVDF